ncbi:MAG TPA: hypothetical protein PLO37_03825 [Candidatus Hydrogenedentes bacterium]|nr:hypothetical protein [Candidatus Hydrogenedentota bacterium]HPG65951.1 hypothetical protein [Candidatus Hydrogenedentota bacterium]
MPIRADKTRAAQIANTCGEFEPEAKSRRWNLIEAIGVMTFLLTVQWHIAYPFGVLKGWAPANIVSYVLLGLGGAYILLFSHAVHRDGLDGWGLGNPVALWRSIRNGSASRAAILVAVVAGLTITLTAAFYIHWTEAADFLGIANAEGAHAIKARPLGPVFIVGLGALLAFFFATCVVRYDNFLSAFRTALILAAVLGALLLGAALLVIGPAAFTDFDAGQYALDVFGYVFWGVIQQLLFSSYFGTRFRKGFGPAAAGAPRWIKRFAVSVLIGLFFGLIHIPSWYLLAGTWLLGTCLSWVFMEAKNRNLVALGFVHGFLGSTLGWLFSSGKAGALEVEMRVGPWNLPRFDGPTVIVSTTLVLAGLAAIAWIGWHRSPAEST